MTDVSLSSAEELVVTLGGTQGPPGPRGDYPQDPSDLAPAASVDIDASLSAVYRLTADQDFTLNKPTEGVDGQRLMMVVTQGTGGSHTITLGAGINFGPISVTLSTVEGAIDVIGLMFNEPTDEWLVIAFSRGY